MAAPQPPTSPRRSRGFSVKSDQSHHTNTSGHKSQHSESAEEKARHSLHTKADPLVAMNELQPSTSMIPPLTRPGRESQARAHLEDCPLIDHSGRRLGEVQFGLPARNAA